MRFRTIDGLRGIAALAVVFYHLNQAVAENFDNWVHPSVFWLFDQGLLGVDVFFVISGFVIAYSVRNATFNWSFLGRFALRRSIRLDPPYWAAIALEISLVWVGLKLALADSLLPPLKQVVAHLFYAQNLLGYGDIIPAFWTLCFEIQFYLGLISLFVLGQKLRERVGPETTRAIAAAVFGASFLYSVAVRYNLFDMSAHPGLAIIRWFQFFMGTCVWWVVSGTIHWSVLVGTWAVLTAAVVSQGQPPLQLLPIAVTALIWWSYRRDTMATALSNPAIQFLGTISYSLYLFHAPVGWRLVPLASRVVGGDSPLWISVTIFTISMLVCIAFAWLMWWLLEKPSMALSRSFKLPRRPSPVSKSTDGPPARRAPQVASV